ncbi:aliphatic sulfonates ABC transporter substrate-binding protein [Bacillus cytotoxicus]|uniref:aliphatic sulfonate ABC transporter substrate-binding protein n=1 Tax=Bacillus cytotoxicus TaxID=580165 RepID=UPI000B3601FF|nr:aliphatic sulfonate ABC transporter substrate-binding protein [Bacillus cytotoxicus]AWC28884.1 aliphatic sulfonates ABC transporter substrate-binding protein [Bacillus cytotoxicus]AWC39730.1 aliphatic sulfonates ABC transporter substrate-binding protein [Bacillus cytotoxicus]AWC47661.1 aliphatic sulfonates ABC transporter substrate-binding protein [Bacillus cytotoxicus]AWC52953.1 aliphatic sulfonates ABC transporter substrate-binding protein [Bacillus cytotoxicus]AWC57085.1 aliphatic sulfon
MENLRLKVCKEGRLVQNKKNILIYFTLGILLLLTGCQSKAVSEKNEKGDLTIQIGIQQGLSPLLLAQKKGWFEEEFEKVGVKVKWTEFQSGPPYFEAIASNRLDFGEVGNSPVISAQAANIEFTEIANTSYARKGTGILVKKDSKITSIKDLKGKKVAVAKGSSAFNLLYRALEKAGLDAKDVGVIQLQPDEAQPAFESGSVDAWAIWDPFISLHTLKKGAKVIVDGDTLNIPSPEFIVARTKFAKEHPELVVTFLKVYEKARVWQESHFEEAVNIYASAKKIDPEIVKEVFHHDKPILVPITKDIIKEQQKTADFQYKLHSIKKKIKPAEVVDNTYIEKALKSE